MSPKPDVSEQRRGQILEAATKVFTRLGFDKARVDDIVKEANLSKGAFYWYFKSKDEIILALMDRFFDMEFNEAIKCVNPAAPAQEQLEQMVNVIVLDLEKMMPLMALFYDFFALGLRNKDARKYMGAYLGKFVDLFEPVIRQGVDTGEFRPVDVRETTLAIGALIEGTILLWTYDSNALQVGPQIRVGMKLLMDGLRA